ncbi:MAG TPA: alpha-amylase family glycosyl hydrolase [Geminicoccaceae bacterium]|nr:alpha-amylase family glycosyl hydrolase [Geminicoccus sp.]HMU52509.1 alpha-amylase family glycosyl hydrolase [Geminicoccaceae bacterium]
MPQLADAAPVLGAEVRDGTVAFRYWAPDLTALSVVPERGGSIALRRGEGGWFEGDGADLGPGTLYRLQLDGGDLLPDPVSRFQPEGPLGPSMIIDPASYRWRCDRWPAPVRPVIYEMHLGTFTPEGTCRAAIDKLPLLAEVGITLLEVMPLADFAGGFGWGYDGTGFFAPTRLYGEPDDFRAFVDAAHALGMGVILDVVYNHVGPVGGFLERFAAGYFTEHYANDWGPSFDYESPASAPVRAFAAANAAYWIRDFRLDGLRIDATQNIYDFDDGHEHILALIARSAREAAGDRDIFIVGENEPQRAELIRPREEDGLGFDALWNDDFHHTARVALTGRKEAYFTDYAGRPQELVSAVRHGFLYQGQRYRWQDQPRGTPTLGMPLGRFVLFLQNHDQIANSGRGLPLSRIAGPGCLRAMTAVLLLAPGTPMLFQGQEWGSSRPFYYFAELVPELAEPVMEGRRQSVRQFPSLATPEMQAIVPLPSDPATFAACKLDWDERERHGEWLALHRDLLRLRREDPTLKTTGRSGAVDGAVLGDSAFLLRFTGEAGDDRLLLVNLGVDLELAIMPEPLLAPPAGSDWRLLWGSEDPRYGGSGQPSPTLDAAWVLPGHAALLLEPGPEASSRRSEHAKALAAAAAPRRPLPIRRGAGADA